MYTPLHVHSDASLLDAISKPSDIAKRIQELNLSSCAITDHGSISASIEFIEECTKKNIKPIIGCELYICDQHSTIQNTNNRSLTHLVVLAKNHQGWKTLSKIISYSNSPTSFYHRPRLSLDELGELCDNNIVGFSGHLGSHMSNIMFDDIKTASECKTKLECRQHLHKDCVKYMEDMASKLQSIFGKENFFLEIQLVDKKNLPIMELITDGLRYISKKINIPKIATPDAHYCKRENAIDQRILLFSGMKTTLQQIKQDIALNKDVGLKTFFLSNNYYIPSFEEMSILHKGFEDELENTNIIANMCETYSLINDPMLPKYSSESSNKNSTQLLRELCAQGFEKLKEKIYIVCEKKNLSIDDYRKRYKYEEQIIIDAGLENYFLIVYDIIRKARELEMLNSPGRGSAGGCLISYLLRITDVDPLEYDLLFERFYTPSRKKSLPDIDLDLPKQHRSKIVDYLKEKYGENRVFKICTFGTLQGKSAIKEVLRNYNVSFDEQNDISTYIFSKEAVSDLIEEQRQETGSSSLIELSLSLNAEALKPWCFRKEDGTLDGPLAERFEQAIRLEQVKKNLGVHAAAIVITPENITDYCPLIISKNKELVLGFDMIDVEKCGLVKLDVLGLAILDKLMMVEDLVNGDIECP